MAKRNIRKTKRTRMIPWSDDRLREALYEAETAAEKRKYSEMLSGAQIYPDARLWYTNWDIVLKSDGTRIGELGFKGPPNEGGAVELRYMLLPEYRGRGYGEETVREIIDWAFREGDVYYVMAETEHDNLSFQRLLKKLEFRETGRFGEIGPRYERERPPSEKTKSMAALGVSLGLLLGVFPLGDLNAGILIGAFAGYAVGAYSDAKDRRKKEILRQKPR